MDKSHDPYVCHAFLQSDIMNSPLPSSSCGMSGCLPVRYASSNFGDSFRLRGCGFNWVDLRIAKNMEHESSEEVRDKRYNELELSMQKIL